MKEKKRHKKKGSGVVRGQGQISGRGNGAGRFPAAIFSLIQTFSAPQTWQLPLDSSSSSSPRPTRQRNTPAVGHSGHSRKTGSLATRPVRHACPAPAASHRDPNSQQGEEGAKKAAENPKGTQRGTPELTSYSARLLHTTRETEVTHG